MFPSLPDSKSCELDCFVGNQKVGPTEHVGQDKEYGLGTNSQRYQRSPGLSKAQQPPSFAAIAREQTSSVPTYWCQDLPSFLGLTWGADFDCSQLS